MHRQCAANHTTAAPKILSSFLVGKSWLVNAEEDFFLNLPIRINRQNRKSIQPPRKASPLP
jgi:hypothetical protein